MSHPTLHPDESAKNNSDPCASTPSETNELQKQESASKNMNRFSNIRGFGEPTRLTRMQASTTRLGEIPLKSLPELSYASQSDKIDSDIVGDNSD
jgi:hypothetical protein